MNLKFRKMGNIAAVFTPHLSKMYLIFKAPFTPFSMYSVMTGIYPTDLMSPNIFISWASIVKASNEFLGPIANLMRGILVKQQW